jgi:hypothetical protein
MSSYAEKRKSHWVVSKTFFLQMAVPEFYADFKSANLPWVQNAPKKVLAEKPPFLAEL